MDDPGWDEPRGRTTRRRVGAVVVLATMLSAGVGVAQAYTGPAVPCTDRVLTKAFSPWGDQADYFLMAGGTFDRTSDWFLSSLWTAEVPASDGSRSWTELQTRLAGSTPVLPTDLVASQAPAVNVNGYQAGRALMSTPPLGPTGRTLDQVFTSKAVCTRIDEPTIRFQYRDPGVSGATLTVRVYQFAHKDEFTLADRRVLKMNEVVLTSSGTPGWRVSPIVQTGAIHEPTADIVVAFLGSAGSWQVDNLYVDPFRSR